jgi:tRNA(Arg) A34 adenosine deaminase TadA
MGDVKESSSASTTPWFVEIRPAAATSKQSYTEAVIVSPVLPQNCRALILRLNSLQQTAAHHDDCNTHLKRVRTHNKIISVLFSLNHTVGLNRSEDDAPAILLEQLRKENYQISTVPVPARLPETAEEWKEFNAVWPTKYVLTAPPTIDMAEQRLMRQGLQLAQEHGGVVIVDPAATTTSGELRIIATADQEAKEQGYPDNPLATNVLLAIQGVSRLERGALLLRSHDDVTTDAAPHAANNHSTSTRKHRHPPPPPNMRHQQYLCTNYDVYCVQEPSVFEAMALLHSRIRRLVFGQAAAAADDDDHRDCGITQHMIHSLQHTNHRYRAFQLITDKIRDDDDDVSKPPETETP